jgi:hypothetical protein
MHKIIETMRSNASSLCSRGDRSEVRTQEEK